VVSNLDPVIVEKHPALDPHTVLAGCDDLVPEGGVVRRSEETTKPRTGFAADVIHSEKTAVLEAGIQREDLGIEAQRP
jgi:hypothetical protein